MDLDPQALALFTEGFQKILQGIGRLGFDTTDANFADTAARAAKGFHELIHDQRQVDSAVSDLLAKTFPAKYSEMVISKHNTAFGICPHHLLPVIYRISAAYSAAMTPPRPPRCSRLCTARAWPPPARCSARCRPMSRSARRCCASSRPSNRPGRWSPR